MYVLLSESQNFHGTFRLIRGIPSWYLAKPPKAIKPGHPSVGRLNKYW